MRVGIPRWKQSWFKKQFKSETSFSPFVDVKTDGKKMNRWLNKLPKIIQVSKKIHIKYENGEKKEVESPKFTIINGDTYLLLIDDIPTDDARFLLSRHLRRGIDSIVTPSIKNRNNWGLWVKMKKVPPSFLSLASTISR